MVIRVTHKAKDIVVIEKVRSSNEPLELSNVLDKAKAKMDELTDKLKTRFVSKDATLQDIDDALEETHSFLHTRILA